MASCILVLLLSSLILLQSSKASVGQEAKDCDPKYLNVTQGQWGQVRDETPTFMVIATNNCPTGCSISNVHLHCGNFNPVSYVDPSVLRLIAVDDCLLNDGQPLSPGMGITFEYKSPQAYPMDVATITCT